MAARRAGYTPKTMPTDTDIPKASSAAHQLKAVSISDAEVTTSGMVIREDRIAGFLRDDDGPREVIYSIDGGEEINELVTDAFTFDLPALTSGTHSLEIRGVDINGLHGPDHRGYP